MVNLLSANFLRLKKDKIFWGGLLLMAALGIAIPVKKHLDAIQLGYGDNIERALFSCALYVGVTMAVFCSLFIGTDYNDGTIRNKLIVGGRRPQIYLANFILSSVVGLAMCAAFLLPYLCVGIPLLGAFTVDGKVILLTGLTVLLLAVAFASIFTCIAMACQNKAATAVTCILLAFGFLLAGAVLNHMLEVPEMQTFYSLEGDGSMGSYQEPNPKYLEGRKREIVQAIYDVIPGGQAIQCATMAAVNLPRLPVYSLAIILLSTGAGCALFRRKDLK